MTQPSEIATVSIRPDVGVLSVLRHLNYRPWFALAEFVDNSLESFLRHQEEIQTFEAKAAKLSVEIAIDPSSGGIITIRDNAAGIYEDEYQRAFRPAEPPPQLNGLSEFGMGMKSAACWFGSSFTVRSCALGESVERIVTFNIDDIVRTKTDTLPVKAIKVPAEYHYTEVVLANLHKPPQGRTIAKIKEHLASIYRVFIREGTLELRFRSTGIDEILTYEEPEILYAKPDDSLVRRRKLASEPCLWRKEIRFDFGSALKVTGFAALRKKGSTAKAGFALFRRKRLIEGSGEDSYRPPQIFGATTTAVYQRLFGELHLEGFEVSHTKDGFKWDENEEPFLDLLREHLNSDPIPLIDQAREASYESYRTTDEELNNAATEAVKDTSEVLRVTVAPVLDQQISAKAEIQAPPPSLSPVEKSWKDVFDVELHGAVWKVTVEVTNDPAVGDWLRVFDTGSIKRADGIRQLGVSLSLCHPFMTKFVGNDLDRIKPFMRLAAAIGLAEITARESGARQAGEVRRNINQLLKDALSKS
jgi:hypothetical protein